MDPSTSDARTLAGLILRGTRATVAGERFIGRPMAATEAPALPDPSPAPAGRTNPSFRFGDAAVLKVYARPEPGPHPEVEIGTHLGRVRFPHVAPFLGWAERERDGAAVAVLHALLTGGETAWEAVRGAFAAGAGPPAGLAGRLGGLVAGLHRALADHRGDEAFRPEPLTPRYVEDFRRSAEALLDRVLPLLPDLPAAKIRQQLLRWPGEGEAVALQRVHGDLHLDQILRVADGFGVLDFEGEPDRPLAERRRKHPPERDLAGMLRSFHYAACAAGAPDGAHEAPAREFLAGYAAAGARPDPALLDLFLLEKAVYEAGYEYAHRPDWLPIPLAGLRALLGEKK
jgi:predicted trehalose synthase